MVLNRPPIQDLIMKRPILSLLEEGSVISSSQEQLSSIVFEVPYAQRDTLVLPEGIFITQSYSNYLYFMEIVEIKVEQNICLPYQLLDFSVFLFFMLEGHGRFATKEGRNLSEVHQGSCYLTANAAGRYNLHLEKGTHIIAYITPRVEWITSYGEKWPLLVNFILDVHNTVQHIAFMDKTMISRAMSKRLIRIWRPPIANPDDLEFHLIHEITGLLHAYYDAIQSVDQIHYLRSEEKVYAINRYLDQTFHCAGVGEIKHICEKFQMTERTLRRAFYKVNGKTITSYLKDIRVTHAQTLLLDSDFPVQKIAKHCGFKSTNYFCRVFSERCGCSPTSFRKQATI